MDARNLNAGSHAGISGVSLAEPTSPQPSKMNMILHIPKMKKLRHGKVLFLAIVTSWEGEGGEMGMEFRQAGPGVHGQVGRRERF